jgi:hypothetical protein
VLDCSPVGAPCRSLTVACGLALAFVPSAIGATGDLRVSVAHLTVPSKIQSGKTVSFGVRYIVRGPGSRRALATVKLVLKGSESRFSFSSNPARVRPAIWKWEVQDTVPALAPGNYTAITTVTLKRSGKVISTAQEQASVSVTAPS